MFFLVTSKHQLFLQNSDQNITPLTFLIIGGNHDDILRSNQALSISFLRITCQAYTYHHFRVLRVKLKPRPLKCKCCHKPLKALLPIAVVVGQTREQHCL